MPFIKTLNKDFYIEDGRITLSESFINSNKKYFKKITGSRLASILGVNSFSSPSKAWAIMVGIYKEDVSDFYTKPGQIIEPKIFDYVIQKTNINYKNYDPFKIKWDVFQDNEIFGGIPDGEPINNYGDLDYNNNNPMLEIKTTSWDKFQFIKNGNNFNVKIENNMPVVKTPNEGLKKWFNKGEIIIPIEYSLQLSLYMYLRGASKGIFAVAFLHPEDYINPESFDVENRKVYLADFSYNKEEFSKYYEYSKNWYNTYIKQGYSPKLDPHDDLWIKEIDLNG
jgi:hypothetical protein